MNTPAAKLLKDYKKPNFLVDNIELTIELNAEQTKVCSKTRYINNTTGKGELFLNGEQQKLLSIKLDGQTLTSDDYHIDESGLSFSTNLDAFELVIETEIDPVNNTSLEGLYLSGGAYCTQCEAEGFRRITFYPDRPDVLAKFTTHIIANTKEYPYLLSNGNKTAEEKLDDGRTKVTWVDPFRKPCYLFALVAGDFDVLRDSFTTKSNREIALEIFVDKGNMGRAPHAMESLKASMRWDEERFNLEYDLDIYMIVAVDFFNMGAMENKGLNVFNSSCVLADSQSATDAEYLRIESIVGHEYFHNWTGNRVTCRDWFQLSLKEGLTVFRDQEFSMDLGSRAVNRIQQVGVMRDHQFAEDAGPMSHPIRPESVIEMNNFYTVTVYDKGAEVIRMMHSILGEDKFQQGMALYFERHDGQAVTCDDFVAAMEDASKIDLSLFRRWYSQSGTPIVTATEDYDADSGVYKLTLSQNTQPTADQKNKLPLHIPINVGFFSQTGQPLAVEGGAEQVLNLTQPSQTFEFNAFEKPYVSLLRDFSAPVKLNFEYSDDALACLIPAETSDFTKWELTQALYVKHLKAKISDSNYQYPSSIPQILKQILMDTSLDKALLAELLCLPTFATMLEHFETVDVDAILSARKSLIEFIAESLVTELQQTYSANHSSQYQYSQKAIAQRSLANVCLSLLADVKQDSPAATQAEIAQLVVEQFDSADNMTDSLAAMNIARKLPEQVFSNILKQFDQKWRGDALVMDKWFSTQARMESDTVFDKLDDLQQHPDFNWKNPNKVRSLFGAFAMGNHEQFHHSSGRGYQYLASVITKLNTINPQIAARLINPLIQYRKLDPSRQNLIKLELEKLAKIENLSSDLYEKITKALKA
ncbi:aminopeptidase N [Catenovulum maritimum]|uniref:Aminopeptidase N n=2 Tax=Catenovulum maritimum TaxID=1513271 RepID=A0A0J8JP59_9ALTE|nr:aminopeptidase N [Catenovulum maritimum]